MAEKLFIIGNGFDLYHHIKSSYADFCSWCQENGHSYEAINTYIMGGDPGFWSHFEEMLDELDEDNLRGDAGSVFSESYNGDYQFELENRLDILTVDIKEDLSKWVSVLNSAIDHLDLKRIKKLGYIDGTGLFLNFNYTNSLEEIYQIPDSRILHIHGKWTDTPQGLILGHGSDPSTHKNKERIKHFQDRKNWPREAEENNIPYTNDRYDEHPQMEEGEVIISDYYEKNYKNTKKLISRHRAFFNKLDPIKEIYILGHSLSEIDMPYFCKIKAKVRSATQWNVSYHSDDEKKRFCEKLLKLGIPASQITIKKINAFSQET